LPAALLAVVVLPDLRVLHADHIRSLSLFTANEAEVALNFWTFPCARAAVRGR
jgi:hypothetical protein